MNDIFEKIIAREIPAAIIYENDSVISFLDIRPTNKGHALVVPKQKCENIFDAPVETLANMIRASKIVAEGLRASLGADGVNLVMNNGAAAGQEVFHAHMHVIPRFTNDGVFETPKHVAYDAGESDTLAEKIRAVLSEAATD